MQVKHEFPRGSLCLAKVQGHPHWPAKVLDCLRNGSYRVVFFGEKSEATVLPQMVIEFSPPNLAKLKKQKEAARNKTLREALRIAERVLEEREKGNDEFEDEALMCKKVNKSRLKRQLSPSNRSKDALLSRSLSSSFYPSPHEGSYK
jgi:hypothetical protein